MEEVRRVTTTRKSNKLVTTLLIIAGILGLVLIAAAVYFYMIKPSTIKTTTTRTCACYYIDPAVTSECGDTRKGFMFKTTTLNNSGSCQNICQTSDLPMNEINSTTKQELFLSCPLSNIQDVRCTEMTVKDKEGKIVTGKILPNEEITIEAKFDKVYSDPEIRLNSTQIKPDSISDDKLVIKKTLSSFTTSSIDIVATAKDSTGEQINSPLCKRIIAIEQTGTANVTGLVLSKRVDEKKNKVSSAVIRTANISDTTGYKIYFSFDNQKFTKLTMTKGFTLDDTKGEISILEQDLYNAANYESGGSFSQLDDFIGTLKVVAELIGPEKSLGTASANIQFSEIKDTVTEVPTTPKEESVESNFSLTGTTNVTCLDRVSPNNSAVFTVNITNNASTSQTILSVKNKLPLGFTYTPSSSKINSVSITDANYLKVNTVGETKELIWSTTRGWSISAGQSLTLVFQAEVGPSTLTGNNLNEIVIEPAQVPAQPSSLRTEMTINVAQSCHPTDQTTQNTPETGIFDTMLGRIITGIIILAFGWYIYNKPFGQVMVKKFVDSEVYKGAEMTSWKMFKPRKYFEENTIKKITRE